MAAEELLDQKGHIAKYSAVESVAFAAFCFLIASSLYLFRSGVPLAEKFGIIASAIVTVVCAILISCTVMWCFLKWFVSDRGNLARIGRPKFPDSYKWVGLGLVFLALPFVSSRIFELPGISPFIHQFVQFVSLIFTAALMPGCFVIAFLVRRTEST